MRIRDLHHWELTPAEAREVQDELVDSVDVSTPLRLEPGCVVLGVDISYLKTAAHTTAFAAAVVMSWPDCNVVEVQTASSEVAFPYVPGLLTFRELPVLLQAISKVQHNPAMIFSDGHGIAHPKRMGIASHLGLVTSTPTIGIAKKPFRTTWTQPAQDVGSTTPLYQGNAQIGYSIRTSARRKYPVFVSPGHLVRIEDVVEPVLVASAGTFLPRPQQAAHDEVSNMRAAAVNG